MAFNGAPARSMWSGKWAFILAAAASAVGLGNLWRFPYLAAKYGGGIFLITYLVLVVTFGFALMMLETALGRTTGQSAIGAFRSLSKKYAFIGYFTSLIPFIIVPYYCVIGGWVTKYAAAYLIDGAAPLADGGTYFNNFISGGGESFLWLLIFTVFTCVVVALGVKNGIERANRVLMPVLIVMSIGVAIFVMTMPGALDGVLYYLTPDFSKFSVELVIAAMGQMFYSLSLAMGIMITFGSYLNKKDDLEQSVRRIEVFDTGFAFLAGLMVVPAAFVAMGSGDAVAAASGPSLMFVALPQIFVEMGSVAQIVGFLFFLLVIFAALTSSISLLETCVSIICDALRCTRRTAFIMAAAFLIIVACIVNLGYTGLSFIAPLGEGTTILDFCDFISNSVMMPISALLTCIFVGWIIKPQRLIDEVKVSSPFKAQKLFVVMVKYIAPVLVVIILVAYVAQQFGLFVM